MNSLKEKALAMPMSPGVYLMKSENGEIIYIGKAKVLKNRVASYFRRDSRSNLKTKKMVSMVYDFSYIITNNELEALILECNLIKKHKPRYNILLKDDKGYSYIKITRDYWPRLIFEKQITQKDKYLGPYASSFSTQKILDEAKRIFKLPSCNRKFYEKTEENFKKIKDQRPCLYYYINRCNAPCCAKISHEEFVENTNYAIKFLKNLNFDLIKDLTKKMNEASDNLNFEKASRLRDKIFSLNKIKQKQNVDSIKTKDQDVIAMCKKNSKTCFGVFEIRDKKLINKETFFLDHIENDPLAFEKFIEQYYFSKTPPEKLVINTHIENKDLILAWLSKKIDKKVQIITPKNGEQLKIVRMCENNAKESLLRKVNKKEAIVTRLQKFLNLKNEPKIIEAYDISNTGQTSNVGGMVVFKNGKPCKKSYKKFKVPLEKQDDYSSTRDIIKRRFNNFLKNEKGFEQLPDLILLDGGKGHLKVVSEVLNLKGFADIPVLAMVKDSKHKTRAIISKNGPINIKSDNEIFLFISKIQEEIHRFTISYHRSKRKNESLKVSLTSVSGIGKKRAKSLLLHFSSLEEIKKASVSELQKAPLITKNLALKIKDAVSKGVI